MKTKRKLLGGHLHGSHSSSHPRIGMPSAVPKPNCSSFLELTEQRVGLFGAHKKRLA